MYLPFENQTFPRIFRITHCKYLLGRKKAAERCKKPLFTLYNYWILPKFIITELFEEKEIYSFVLSAGLSHAPANRSRHGNTLQQLGNRRPSTGKEKKKKKIIAVKWYSERCWVSPRPYRSPATITRSNAPTAPYVMPRTHRKTFGEKERQRESIARD